MDAVQIIEQSLDHATGLVRQVRVHHLNAQTPCSEWDVRALLNHMMNELAWEPDMLAGRTVAEVGTSHERDYTGGDIVSRWEEYAFIAVERAKRADVDSTVHLSYGDVPARHYLAELGSDILVHAWDLGAGPAVQLDHGSRSSAGGVREQCAARSGISKLWLVRTSSGGG